MEIHENNKFNVFTTRTTTSTTIRLQLTSIGLILLFLVVFASVMFKLRVINLFNSGEADGLC